MVCTTCRKNVQFIVNVDGVKLYCALCAGMEGQVVKLCGWIKLKSNVRVSAIKKTLGGERQMDESSTGIFRLPVKLITVA